jgi:hypothetical protein
MGPLSRGGMPAVGVRARGTSLVRSSAARGSATSSTRLISSAAPARGWWTVLLLVLHASPALSVVCEDKLLADGTPWHDAGGDKYDCLSWYNTAKRCERDGGKNAVEGATAEVTP